MALEFEAAINKFIAMKKLPYSPKSPLRQSFYDSMAFDSPHVFVFLDVHGYTTWNRQVESPEDPLSLPFQYCAFSFENMNKVPVISVVAENKQMGVHTILVKEMGPYSYGFYLHGECCNVHCGHKIQDMNHILKYHEIFSIFTSIESEQFYRSDRLTLEIRAFIENVCLKTFHKDSELATEKFKRRVPVRNKRNKIEQRKINKVIYVRPKGSTLQPYESGVSAHVEWSHSWLVRGHWRRAAGIGKNRQGDYSVNGFTWVTDHKKGGSGQLVEKIRIMKNGS